MPKMKTNKADIAVYDKAAFTFLVEKAQASLA